MWVHHPCCTIPIPSSRGTVPTGYGFVMPDQNGWSRYLHFQTAWALVLTGLVYGLAGLWTGHFWRSVLGRGDRKWRAYWGRTAQYLRRAPPEAREANSYNVLQRTAYLGVIFVLFPLVIWTGWRCLRRSISAVPAAVTCSAAGNRRARLHFFCHPVCSAFLLVHVAMVGWRDSATGCGR